MFKGTSITWISLRSILNSTWVDCLLYYSKKNKQLEFVQQVLSYLSVCPILIFHFPVLPVQVPSVLVLVTSNQSSGPSPLAVTVFRKTTLAYNTSPSSIHLHF